MAALRADAAAAAGEQEFRTPGARDGGGGGGDDDLRGAGDGLLRESMVCPVFAALPQEQQLEAFEPAPKGTRKFVLVRARRVFLIDFRSVLMPFSVSVFRVRFPVDFSVLLLECFRSERSQKVQISNFYQTEPYHTTWTLDATQRHPPTPTKRVRHTQIACSFWWHSSFCVCCVCASCGP